MKKFVIFVSLLLTGLIPASANKFEFNENCSNAYKLAFAFRFTESVALLNKEIDENPANTSVYYILNYIDFLKAFTTEETVHFEALKNNIDFRIKQIEKTEKINPWRNVAKGDMLLQLAVNKLKHKEYLSAGYYIRKAFKLIEANYESHPDFTPNLKSMGFLHSVVGSVPENYKWLANLVGMKGSIPEGVQEMEQAYKQCMANNEFRFMTDEVFLLRLFVTTHFAKDQSAANKMIESHKANDISSSPLLTFIIANSFIAGDKFDDALKTLSDYNPLNNTFPLHYLNYMKGNLLMNNLNSEASRYLNKYVTEFKGNSFIKSAWLKLAWIDLLNNNKEGYSRKKMNVINKGNDFTDEDKQALNEVNSETNPNLYLLRSRLLFDGGNYNEALEQLAGKPSFEFPTLKEQIEFTYRLARIFDKKNQTDKALRYYKKTYENGKSHKWYFAANAALLTAFIYENQDDYSQAIEWYKKCLNLRQHEYQNSIDQKAEAGLNRLEAYKSN